MKFPITQKRDTLCESCSDQRSSNAPHKCVHFPRRITKSPKNIHFRDFSLLYYMLISFRLLIRQYPEPSQPLLRSPQIYRGFEVGCISRVQSNCLIISINIYFRKQYNIYKQCLKKTELAIFYLLTDAPIIYFTKRNIDYNITETTTV